MSSFVDGVLAIQSGDSKIRWFLLKIFTVTLPLIAIFLHYKQPEKWWFLCIPVIAWFIASLFPDRELDTENRLVTLKLRFLQRGTLFSWSWQVGQESRVQIHVQAFRNSNGGVQGWVHKGACVEKRRRITLRDFVRKIKDQSQQVEEFALEIAVALKLPCDGYVEKPGFFLS